MIFKAHEVLKYFGVERCRECNCVVAEDWKFVDFTNKNVVECPQCETKYYIEELKEREE